MSHLHLVSPGLLSEGPVFNRCFPYKRKILYVQQAPSPSQTLKEKPREFSWKSCRTRQKIFRHLSFHFELGMGLRSVLQAAGGFSRKIPYYD